MEVKSDSSLHLVDTDILIDVGRRVPKATYYLASLGKNFRLGISIITELELIVGCQNKQELGTLEKFLAHFRIVPINEQISDTARHLLNIYRLSHGLLIPDAFIAATAMVTGAPLSTKNQWDYRFIEGLSLQAYLA